MIYAIMLMKNCTTYILPLEVIGPDNYPFTWVHSYNQGFTRRLVSKLIKQWTLTIRKRRKNLTAK